MCVRGQPRSSTRKPVSTPRGTGEGNRLEHIERGLPLLVLSMPPIDPDQAPATIDFERALRPWMVPRLAAD
jgi:hypothetical protein